MRYPALVLVSLLTAAGLASAQTKVTPVEALRLTTVPCQITSGTAAPSGGNNCDMYLRSDGTLWVKAGGAWTGIATPTLTVSSDKVWTGTYTTQVEIQGATDPLKKLVIGLDTTNNYGVLHAYRVGPTYYPLALNPEGGGVSIGATDPGAAKLKVVSSAPTDPYAGILLMTGTTVSYTSYALGRETPDFWIGVGRNGDYLMGSLAGDTMMVHSGRLLFGASIGGAIHASMDTSGNMMMGEAEFVAGGVDGTLADALYFNSTGYGGSGYARSRVRVSNSATQAANKLVFETSTGTVGAWNDNQLVLAGSGFIGVGAAPDTFRLQVAGDVGPNETYTHGLGSAALKWGTLDVAEIHASALIAEERIATIGGRVAVAPTTILAAAVDTDDTTIQVKHQLLINGDRIVLETVGQVEWMAVTSAPTGTGPYTYSVTRNLDGTGANTWPAGDAVMSTGTTGSGWMDQYADRSLSSINSYKAAVLRDRPVAYWRQGEPSGTSGTDATGNGYALTYTGSPTMGEAGPLADGATGITYSGNTKYAKRDSMAVLGGTNLAQDFTIETWAKTPDGDGGELVSQSLGTATHSFIHLYIYPAAYVCEVANNAGGTALTVNSGATDYTDGAWHHVVCAWDTAATTFKLYVDGALKNTATGAPTGTVDAMTTTTLGTRWRSSAAYGAGAVDSTVQDTAFYQYALSDTRVAAHYAARTYTATTDEVGPSIVGNVRTGTTWNAYAPRWAVGNLRGLYGYTGTTFGFAAGDAAETWMAMDATNGFRIMHGGTTIAEVDETGAATFTGVTVQSSPSGSRTVLSTDGLKLYNGASNIGILDSDGVRIQPNPSATGWDGKYMYGWIGTYAGLRFYLHPTDRPNDVLQLMTQGRNAFISFVDPSDGDYIAGWTFHYDPAGSGTVALWGDTVASQIGLSGTPITHIYASAITLGGTSLVSFPGASASSSSCGGGGHVDSWTADGNGLITGFGCSVPTWPREIASLRALVADLQARLAALEAGRQR
jgi:hypothetical protein